MTRYIRTKASTSRCVLFQGFVSFDAVGIGRGIRLWDIVCFPIQWNVHCRLDSYVFRGTLKNSGEGRSTACEWFNIWHDQKRIFWLSVFDKLLLRIDGLVGRLRCNRLLHRARRYTERRTLLMLLFFFFFIESRHIWNAHCFPVDWCWWCVLLLDFCLLPHSVLSKMTW